MTSTDKPGFTPGPWAARFFRDDAGKLSGTGAGNFHIVDDRGSLLEGGLVLEDDSLNEANGHLIAAAPELYEAAAYMAPFNEAIDAHLSGQLGEVEFIKQVIDLHDAEAGKLLRAALAKAEGRT